MGPQAPNDYSRLASSRRTGLTVQKPRRFWLACFVFLKLNRLTTQKGNPMSTSAASRKSRYAPTVVTKNELLDLLNDDFTRECKAIYAHAVFAERLKSVDAAKSRTISCGGQQTVLEALSLCQL